MHSHIQAQGLAMTAALSAQATHIPHTVWAHIQSTWAQLPDFLRHYALQHQRHYMHCPHHPHHPHHPHPSGSASGVNILHKTDREAELKMGDFRFSFNKTNQKIEITDTLTGKKTHIQNDPEYFDHDGKKAISINGDTITVLRDGTRLFNDTKDGFSARVGIVRPDGSTVFIDNLTGSDPLKVLTPPPGRLPLDYLGERVRDFHPEAVLQIIDGHWADANGMPLKGRVPSTNGLAWANALMSNGIYPAALYQRDDFDKRRDSPGWHGALQRLATVLGDASRSPSHLLLPMLDEQLGRQLLLHVGPQDLASVMGLVDADDVDENWRSWGQLPTAVRPWMMSVA